MVCLEVGVSEQLLHGADVVTVHEQVCREAVAQCVTARGPREAGTSHSGLDRALQYLLVQMVSHRPARVGVGAKAGGGEQVLPAPLGGRLRILARQREGQRDTRLPSALLVLEPRMQPAECARKGITSEPGSMVTRSRPPLPSRTISSPRSSARSLTRSRRPSVNRSPLPYSRLAISHGVSCSCARSVATSSRLSTTGSRFACAARVMFSSHGSSMPSTWRYRNSNACSAWFWVATARCVKNRSTPGAPSSRGGANDET
jgi:hypothetical protein